MGHGKDQCSDLAMAVPTPDTSLLLMLILIEEPMSSPDPQHQEAR